MSKQKTIAVGHILSESSFYRVLGVEPNNSYKVEDALGNHITISKQYADEILISANHVEKEEQATKTQLADLFINSPRMALTVAFLKQDKPKTKRAYKQEKENKIAEIQSAPVSKVTDLLNNLIDNPILNYTPGELRVMRGYHEGNMDELGRVQFTDMEITSGHNLRQVDPRSIQFIIVKGIKYILK